VGIRRLAGQRPAQLSGGELRRASIARALINAPRLLVADEPTADLDPGNAALVMGLFEEAAREGAGVLVATHDQASAARCARRVGLLGGRLAEAGGACPVG